MDSEIHSQVAEVQYSTYAHIADFWEQMLLGNWALDIERWRQAWAHPSAVNSSLSLWSSEVGRVCPSFRPHSIPSFFWLCRIASQIQTSLRKATAPVHGLLWSVGIRVDAAPLPPAFYFTLEHSCFPLSLRTFNNLTVLCDPRCPLSQAIMFPCLLVQWIVKPPLRCYICAKQCSEEMARWKST